MECSRLLLVNILFCSLITAGFIYQSLLISIDYFEFKTTTLVSVLNFPKQLVYPTMALCTSPPITRRKTFKSMKKIFQDSILDNVTFNKTAIWDEVQENSEIKNGSNIDFDQFFKKDFYCHTFRPRRLQSIKVVETFFETDMPMYYVNF